MRDLRNLYVRANACVACHQTIDADIIAAGHPDLVFELNSQSIAQPKHWHDEEGSGARSWLIGQAVALRELSWSLRRNPTPDAQSLAQWQALTWLLGKVTAAEQTLGPIQAAITEDQEPPFFNVQEQSDALARRAAQQNFGEGFAKRVLGQLTAVQSEFIETNQISSRIFFHRAQRLVLALDALTERNLHGDYSSLSANLGKLLDDVRSPSQFEVADFKRHLAEFQSALQAAGTL